MKFLFVLQLRYFLYFAGIHKNIVNICHNYGPNFLVWLFNEIIIVVGKPEDVETVLQSPMCVEKNLMYRFTMDLVGNGLFTAPRKPKIFINKIDSDKLK